MIEAVMLWNEPNNKSHWDFELDPDWSAFAAMVRAGGHGGRRGEPAPSSACSAASRRSIRTSSLNMDEKGVLACVDAVAVHGFPLDWNHWHDPRVARQARVEIRAVTTLPVWVSEVGVSTFGAEEVQEFGLSRTAELLLGRAPRIHWYSLSTCRGPGRPRRATARPRARRTTATSTWAWCARTARRSARSRRFSDYTPELGICQWFHFEDHRLDEAVGWLKRLGVKQLRTGLSWADSLRPDALAWFDRQMAALEPFDVTLTFCFTPESRGVRPHHTSPPRDPDEYADFCARMTRRYAG